MKRAPRWMFCLGLVAGCGGSLPEPAAPTPAASAVRSGEARAPLADGVYRFDEKNSLLEVEGSDRVTGRHRFWFEAFDGSVSIDQGALTLRMHVPMKTLRHSSSVIEKYIRSDAFFDVERHPEVRFEGKAEPTEAPSVYRVQGDLTMHGVTRAISFQATFEQPGEIGHFRANVRLIRHDFDIRPSAPADSLIRLEIDVKLDLKAPRTPAPAGGQGGPSIGQKLRRKRILAPCAAASW